MGDSTKGVSVTLAPYKDGALEVRVPRFKIGEAQIEAALAASKKPYRLVPVRFVEEGGTKMGHTVLVNWDARVDGAAVPGSKHDMFELELKEGAPEPWGAFAKAIAVGMGQMETKVFPAAFPEDFKVEGLRGKTAMVTAVVRQITRREEKPPETRTDDELRKEIVAKGEAQIEAKTAQLVDVEVKKALLDTCDVDADKVFNSVSWAKFGEKSAKDFKWNCIKEKIASEEGIEARDVAKLLRESAKITLVERPAASK